MHVTKHPIPSNPISSLPPHAHAYPIQHSHLPPLAHLAIPSGPSHYPNLTRRAGFDQQPSLLGASTYPYMVYTRYVRPCLLFATFAVAV